MSRERGSADNRTSGITWEYAAGGLGLGLILYGQYLGLLGSPAEMHMGEVARILYVHVPAAWIAMLTFGASMVASIGWLLTSNEKWDWAVEATVEVGVMFGVMLLLLGSIFARPTWHTWWTWDPRLTSSAVMVMTYVGVLLLRSVVLDPGRRANWSAVVSIIAVVNLVITYMSVRWWRSMHQMQSSPDTMSDSMVVVLRINAVAFLLIAVFFVVQRWRLARELALADQPDPLPPEEVLS